MPFYEYECQSCKFYTEVMQKISDAPLTKCPSCGKRQLKKLVSAPVFRLKGGGWYETDFKSDKENKRNLLGSEKEEAKPESKPEAKERPAEAKEAKERKEAAATAPAKPGDAKPVEAKAAGAAPASSAPARRSVSMPGKGISPVRKAARSGRRRSARTARR
jgi:putative FmdB family regulatory protein